ncbi:hypothetical protein [Ascidiimonas sp. W6]|uniref:hypothetical protein n=1 Tax=Ascidiimonas meishanensis TaxID=3128903 RepID=UPI0030EE682B
MQNLKLIFNFYLHASIHVAFAVIAFYKVTCISLNIPETRNLVLVLFFGTIVMYNFMKYGSRAKGYFIVKSKYEKLIQIISFIAGSFLIFFLVKLSIDNLIFLGMLVIISLLYILPFTRKGENLRSFANLKVYAVSLVWSGSTVLLPFSENLSLINFDVWIVFLQRFILVIVLILPFEIRDMKSDAADLITIPRNLGIKKTKKLGYLLLVVLILLELFKTNFQIEQLIVLFISMAVLSVLLKLSNTSRSFYFTAFWVESIPILLWLLTLVFI